MCVGTIPSAEDPIAAVLDFEGAAVADYERLSHRLHASCRHRRLQGCLYHWMKHYPEGFRVIEFWRGRESFERFLVDEFQPLLAELGLGEPLLTIESMPAQTIAEAEGLEPDCDDQP